MAVRQSIVLVYDKCLHLVYGMKGQHLYPYLIVLVTAMLVS